MFVFAYFYIDEHYLSSMSSDSESDAPFNVSETLIPFRDIKPVDNSSVSFDGILDNPLVLKEDLKDGCGGQLWPAGMVLAKYLLRRHHSDFSGKTMSVYLYSFIDTFYFLVWYKPTALGYVTDSWIELNWGLGAVSLGLLLHGAVPLVHLLFILQTSNRCCL